MARSSSDEGRRPSAAARSSASLGAKSPDCHASGRSSAWGTDAPRTLADGARAKKAPETVQMNWDDLVEWIQRRP